MTEHAPRSLHVRASLNLTATMGIIGMGGDPTFRKRESTVEFATRTAEGPASARFVQRGDTVTVEAWGGGAATLMDRAEDLIGAHDDAGSFTPADQPLRDIARRFAGLRMTRGANPLEVAARTIFGQRVTSTEAMGAWRRFVYRYGEPAPGPLGLRSLPTWDQVGAFSSIDIHHCALDRSRGVALVAMAREAERLQREPDVERFITRLRRLPNIGIWTETTVRHVAFGDPDAVILGDWHVGRNVCFALSGEMYGDDRRMLELLEPYVGHRGRVMRLLGAAGIGHPRRAPGRPINPLVLQALQPGPPHNRSTASRRPTNAFGRGISGVGTR
jgi:3-methyladenine DNA glycosylase/8-oxoguanine DNA glycosylase